MAAAPDLWAVGRDVLWCLGLGLLLSAVRDLAGLLFGNGRVLGFIWDLVTFSAAAVLLCGFAASASTGGGARWYMALGMGAGALAWQWAVSGTLHNMTHRLSAWLGACTGYLQKAAAAPFVHLRQRYRSRKQTKNALKSKKIKQKVTKRKKQLQKRRKILYN